MLDRRASDLAIDLGTANTLIHSARDGLVLNEPSVVAIRHEGGARGRKHLLAVGQEAHAMAGRLPANVEIIRPVRDGVIAEFDVTVQMLKCFIGKVWKQGMLHRNPRVVINVPCGSTMLERRAIRQVALDAGASVAMLLEDPLAAALGAGLPVFAANGTMVVDLGGGATEVAVLSLGGIVQKHCLRLGGDKLDEAIINLVRRRFGVLIGAPTAELLKRGIGSAMPDADLPGMSVVGLNLSLGMPRSVVVGSSDILEAIDESVDQIVVAVKATLELAPPELASDIAYGGIVLTGGGAALGGLAELLQLETGVPVVIAPEPLLCVVRGCALVLESLARGRHLPAAA